MEEKIAKSIRIITIAPIMATALLLILFYSGLGIYGTTQSLILAIIFIVLLPVLAYPIQMLIPQLRAMGREEQRKIAIIAANVGYIYGIAAAYSIHASKELFIIFLTYLFSGLLIFLSNKFMIKASGHACGVAGPVAVLIYFLGLPYLGGLVLLVLIFWASLVMKRHTLSELILGSLIPVVSLFFAVVCVDNFNI